MARSGRRAAPAVATALALSLLAGPTAQADPPDVAARTPVAAGASARAQGAVSVGPLRAALAAQLRRAGGRAGAWVGDPVSGATLFGRSASRAFQLASNMKLFTTAAALARLGPEERLETQLVAAGPFENGVVRGNLILRGSGDPSLSRKGLAKLAALARASGLARVTGRLLYDESSFDRRRRIPRHGISGGPFAYVGRLSGLAFEGGRSADPARSAAQAMIRLLRKRGVSVSKKTGRGLAPPALAAGGRLAAVSSPPLRALARTTNTFSSNFYAETLIKVIAAQAGRRGTTRGGAAMVRSFAAGVGAPLRAVNGSGLSRANRASPRSVGNLLTAMLGLEPPGAASEAVRAAFIGSLAVAGRTGTLSRRMRGTAAHGRCAGKTGTLTRVSALSGYCDVGGGRLIAFSILMNRVNVGRAHRTQDRMAALIARFRP